MNRLIALQTTVSRLQENHWGWYHEIAPIPVQILDFKRGHYLSTCASNQQPALLDFVSSYLLHHDAFDDTNYQGTLECDHPCMAHLLER